MDLYAFPPLAALLDGAQAALLALADLLEPLAGASGAAAAIVLVTLAVRAALIPVGISQAKAERLRVRLAPRLAELRTRHSRDPERLQREMMALYAAEGTSPLAGCLPLLLQIPVLGVIYAVFVLPTIAGHPNALLDHTLGGVPLGQSLAGTVAAGVPEPGALVVFGVVIAGIAIVAELTRRAFRPQRPASAPGVASAAAASRGGASDPSALLGSERMLRIAGALQFATAVVACFVPLAAGLYLLVTVAWTLAQRLVLRRAYPAPPLAPA